MSNPQGTKADPKRPQSRPVRQPVSAAEVKRQVQPALNAADKKLTTLKPQHRVGRRQDWKRG
jgi:hypothetical protein